VLESEVLSSVGVWSVVEFCGVLWSEVLVVECCGVVECCRALWSVCCVWSVVKCCGVL